MIDFKNNSLNTIRLIAALNVFYGHAVGHLNVTMPEAVNDLVSFFYGVPLFFTLSGFLIWFSIGNSKSFAQYIKKRILRLYPELWVAVIVEIMVMLFLYDHYINKSELFLFIIGQSTIFQFYTPDCLRDYGCGCPNGALATIGVLIQFYLVAFATYKFLRNAKLWRWGLLITISIIINLLTPFVEQVVPLFVFKLYCQTFVPYFWLFIIGAFVSENYKIIVPLTQKYWWVFIIFSIIIYLFDFDITGLRYGILFSIILFLSMLGVAYRFPQLNLKTDLSYALFIYHMTVINAMITIGLTGNLYALVISLVISIAISFVSTKSIGRFSLMMKERLRNTPPST